jgi:lysophospholipase L1-like esterase
MMATEAVTASGVEARPSVTGNVALLALSVALAFVLGEIAARMVLPAPLPWRYPQVVYRSDPNTIFAMVPNQRGFTADKPIAINARGLRGPVVPYARTPGKQRILFLGDSITFGYGVNDAEVVTERVHALLGASGIAAEVVNSAVPSYNMRQEVTFLETEGMRYGPDWVIVGVCWNDIGDKSAVRVDARGRLTTDLAGDGTEPVAAEMRESAFGYEIRNLVKRSRLMYGATEGWRRLTTRGTPDRQTRFRTDVLAGNDTDEVASGWEDVAAQVRRLKELSERGGFRVLMVTFPIPLAIDRPFPKSSYPARLQEIAARENIAVLDLTEAYRAAYHGHESLFIPYDGDHPNAAGHAIAAHEITQYLTAHRGDERS